MSNNKNSGDKYELRQKYAEKGFENLTENEKIRLLMSYCSGKGSEEIAEKLTSQYSTLTSIIDADKHSLEKNHGLDSKALVMLKLIPQLSRAYFMENKRIRSLKTSADALKFFESFFIGVFQEELVAVCTDENFNIKKSKVIFKGSVSSVNIFCRDIVDFAIKNNSTVVFIAHNHPMGSAAPSAGDLSATAMISDSLARIGVSLIDHIIVSRESAVSMRGLPSPMPFDNSDTHGYII